MFVLNYLLFALVQFSWNDESFIITNSRFLLYNRIQEEL